MKCCGNCIYSDIEGWCIRDISCETYYFEYWEEDEE